MTQILTTRRALVLIAAVLSLLCGTVSLVTAQSNAIRLQLNWFHDPTFAAAYTLRNDRPADVNLLEGGPSVFPLSALRTGEAHLAIVGIDIFLRAVGENFAAGRTNSFRLIGVDLQRNPVGYVLHPDVGEKLGLPVEHWSRLSGRERNDWLFEQIRTDRIKVGDKVGTETTAVWTAWLAARLPNTDVRPIGVGFDATIVLQKPQLAFPVYLNEEPFKLAERVGRTLLVFDPADDGVSLYGNVLVTTTEALRRYQKPIASLSKQYFQSWNEVRKDPLGATTLTAKFYKGVPESIVRAQLLKTLEFVFFEGATPGSVDLSEGGKLDRSIKTLRNSRSINDRVTLEAIRPLIIQ